MTLMTYRIGFMYFLLERDEKSIAIMCISCLYITFTLIFHSTFHPNKLLKSCWTVETNIILLSFLYKVCRALVFCTNMNHVWQPYADMRYYVEMHAKTVWGQVRKLQRLADRIHFWLISSRCRLLFIYFKNIFMLGILYGLFVKYQVTTVVGGNPHQIPPIRVCMCSCE